jgi:hypothetical protein
MSIPRSTALITIVEIHSSHHIRSSRILFENLFVGFYIVTLVYSFYKGSLPGLVRRQAIAALC